MTSRRTFLAMLAASPLATKLGGVEQPKTATAIKIHFDNGKYQWGTEALKHMRDQNHPPLKINRKAT